MKVIDTEATQKSLSFDTLVPVLREAFQEGGNVPARHVHSVGCGEDRGTCLIMPAWNDKGYLGVKVINIFPENNKKSLPGLHATYNLYDGRTGVPLAQLDGDVITVYRTAGAAALGAFYLARKDSKTLLIVGSGRVASLVAAAMKSVRRIERVLVWNLRPAGAQKLADLLKEQGLNASAVTDLQRAVEQADIISCSTLSTAPLIRRAWLRPGTHLDLIGSFKPEMIEAEPECFRNTTVYIDTDEAPTKSGDLLQAFDAGVFSKEEIRGTLTDLVKGTAPGRTGDDEITIFKAVGSALEDLVTAAMVYERQSGEK